MFTHVIYNFWLMNHYSQKTRWNSLMWHSINNFMHKYLQIVELMWYILWISESKVGLSVSSSIEEVSTLDVFIWDFVSILLLVLFTLENIRMCFWAKMTYIIHDCAASYVCLWADMIRRRPTKKNFQNIILAVYETAALWFVS